MVTLTATMELPADFLNSLSEDDLRWLEKEVSRRMEIEWTRMLGQSTLSENCDLLRISCQKKV